MRTLLLLSSAAIVLAACSDEQTTGPARSHATSALSSTGVALAANDDPGVPQAKPSTGFTVFIVESAPVASVPSVVQTATAFCPAGSKLVGGGFGFTGVHKLLINRANAYNGWSVAAILEAPYSSGSVSAQALCMK